MVQQIILSIESSLFLQLLILDITLICRIVSIKQAWTGEPEPGLARRKGEIGSFTMNRSP